MPPTTLAPIEVEPITECGSRPCGASLSSSEKSVAPARQTASRASCRRWIWSIRSVEMMTMRSEERRVGKECRSRWGREADEKKRGRREGREYEKGGE